jgi:hypothetical protein
LRFLCNVGQHGPPVKITIDGSGANSNRRLQQGARRRG